jgi:hypothetical protein
MHFEYFKLPTCRMPVFLPISQPNDGGLLWEVQSPCSEAEEVTPVVHRLLSWQHLLDCNKEFQSRENYTPTSGQRVLYVMESEIATNVAIDEFDAVASDDATTCHILLARTVAADPHLSRLLICHLDSSSRCGALEDHLVALSSDKNLDVDIFVCGGLSNDETSTGISYHLYAALSRSAVNCRINLWSSLELNSKFTAGSDLSSPVVMGMCYKSATHQVSPCTIPLSFRGPQLALRAAINFANSFVEEASTSWRFVFNGEDHKFIINAGMLLILSRHEDVQQIASFYLSITNDKDFLLQTSTSPHCEPAHFVPFFREAFSVIISLGNAQREGKTPFKVMAFELQSAAARSHSSTKDNPSSTLIEEETRWIQTGYSLS